MEDDSGPRGRNAGSRRFEFYLQFASPLIVRLPDPNDRLRAASWLMKLRHDGASEDIRTQYIKLLIFALHRKHLVGPFAHNPGDATLQCLPPNSQLVDLAHDMILIETQDKTRRTRTNKGDFPFYTLEFSGNLLEFAAAQEVPGFGAQAYHAVSPVPVQTWDNLGLLPNDVLTRDFSNTNISEMFKKRKKVKSEGRIDKRKDRAKQKAKQPSPTKALTTKCPKKTGLRQPITWGSNLIEVTDPSTSTEERFTPPRQSISTTDQRSPRGSPQRPGTPKRGARSPGRERSPQQYDRVGDIQAPFEPQFEDQLVQPESCTPSRQITITAADPEAKQILAEANATLAEQESSAQPEEIPPPPSPRTPQRRPMRPRRIPGAPREAQRRVPRDLRQSPPSPTSYLPKQISFHDEPLEPLDFGEGAEYGFDDEEAPEFYEDLDDNLNISIEKQIQQIQQEYASQMQSIPAAAGASFTTPSLPTSPLRPNSYDDYPIFEDDMPDFYMSPEGQVMYEDDMAGARGPDYDFDLVVLHTNQSQASSTTSSCTVIGSQASVGGAYGPETEEEDETNPYVQLYKTLLSAVEGPATYATPPRIPSPPQRYQSPIIEEIIEEDDGFEPYTLGWQTPPHLKSPEEQDEAAGYYSGSPVFDFEDAVQGDYLGQECYPGEFYMSPPPPPVTPPRAPEPIPYEELYDPFQRPLPMDGALMEEDEEPLAAIVEAHEMHPYRTNEFTVRVGTRARGVRIPWRSGPPRVEPISEEPEFYYLQSPPQAPATPVRVDYNEPYMFPIRRTPLRRSPPREERQIDEITQVEQNIRNDIQEHFVTHVEEQQQVQLLERVVQAAQTVEEQTRAVQAQERGQDAGVTAGPGESPKFKSPPVQDGRINVATRPKTPPTRLQRGTQYVSRATQEAAAAPQVSHAGIDAQPYTPPPTSPRKKSPGKVRTKTPSPGKSGLPIARSPPPGPRPCSPGALPTSPLFDFDFGPEAGMIFGGTPPQTFEHIEYIDAVESPRTPIRQVPMPRGMTPEFDFAAPIGEFMPEYAPLDFDQVGDDQLFMGTPPRNFGEVEMIDQCTTPTSPMHIPLPTRFGTPPTPPTPPPVVNRVGTCTMVETVTPPMQGPSSSPRMRTPGRQSPRSQSPRKKSPRAQTPRSQSPRMRSPRGASPRTPQQFDFAGDIAEFMPEYGEFGFGQGGENVFAGGTPPPGFADIQMIDSCASPTTPIRQIPQRRSPTPKTPTPPCGALFDFAGPLEQFMPEYGPLDFGPPQGSMGMSPPPDFGDIDVIDAYTQPITPPARVQRQRTPSPQAPEFTFSAPIGEFMPEYAPLEFGQGTDDRLFMGTPPGFADIEMIDEFASPQTPMNRPIPQRFGTPPTPLPIPRFDFAGPVEEFMQAPPRAPTPPAQAPRVQFRTPTQSPRAQQGSPRASPRAQQRPRSPPTQSPRRPGTPRQSPRVSPRAAGRVSPAAAAAYAEPNYGAMTIEQIIEEVNQQNIMVETQERTPSPQQPRDLLGWATPEHLQVQRTPPRDSPRTPPRVYRPNMIYGAAAAPTSPVSAIAGSPPSARYIGEALFDSAGQGEIYEDEDLCLYASPVHESPVQQASATEEEQELYSVMSPGAAAEQAGLQFDANMFEYGQYQYPQYDFVLNQLHERSPVEDIQIEEMNLYESPMQQERIADFFSMPYEREGYQSPQGQMPRGSPRTPSSNSRRLFPDSEPQQPCSAGSTCNAGANRVYDAAAQQYNQLTGDTPDLITTKTTTTTVTEEVYFDENAGAAGSTSPVEPAYTLQWESPPREDLPQYERYVPPPLFKMASPVTPPDFAETADAGLFDEVPMFLGSPVHQDIFEEMQEPYEGISDANIQLYQSPPRQSPQRGGNYQITPPAQIMRRSPYPASSPPGQRQQRRSPQSPKPGPSCGNTGCSSK